MFDYKALPGPPTGPRSPTGTSCARRAPPAPRRTRPVAVAALETEARSAAGRARTRSTPTCRSSADRRPRGRPCDLDPEGPGAHRRRPRAPRRTRERVRGARPARRRLVRPRRPHAVDERRVQRRPDRAHHRAARGRDRHAQDALTAAEDRQGGAPGPPRRRRGRRSRRLTAAAAPMKSSLPSGSTAARAFDAQAGRRGRRHRPCRRDGRRSRLAVSESRARKLGLDVDGARRGRRCSAPTGTGRRSRPSREGGRARRCAAAQARDGLTVTALAGDRIASSERDAHPLRFTRAPRPRGPARAADHRSGARAPYHPTAPQEGQTDAQPTPRTPRHRAVTALPSPRRPPSPTPRSSRRARGRARPPASLRWVTVTFTQPIQRGTLKVTGPGKRSSPRAAAAATRARCRASACALEGAEAAGRYKASWTTRPPTGTSSADRSASARLAMARTPAPSLACRRRPRGAAPARPTSR